MHEREMLSMAFVDIDKAAIHLLGANKKICSPDIANAILHLATARTMINHYLLNSTVPFIKEIMGVKDDNRS